MMREAEQLDDDLDHRTIVGASRKTAHKVTTGQPQ